MARTVLLADDSITIQKVVELAFAEAGFGVLSVNNGADAIRLIRERRPDIVLADVVMPEKTGYEVCAFVKGDPDLRETPVILLRGTFEPWDPARAESVRCDGSVSKPFESDRLVEQVKDLLASRAAAPPAVAAQEAVARSEAAAEAPPALEEETSGHEPAPLAPPEPAAEAPETATTGEAPIRFDLGLPSAIPVSEPPGEEHVLESPAAETHAAPEGPKEDLLEPWAPPPQPPPGWKAERAPAAAEDAEEEEGRGEEAGEAAAAREAAPDEEAEPPAAPFLPPPAPARLGEEDLEELARRLVGRISRELVQEVVEEVVGRVAHGLVAAQAEEVVRDTAREIVRAKVEELEKKLEPPSREE